MKYDTFADEEILDLIKEGDREATDFIINKYKNMVRGKAKSMFILGADKEDIIQEGMIGLYKAVRDFDPGRDASFATFAELCVSRQIYTAIESAGRLKHMPLNSYISIYEEDFQKEGGTNPEEVVLDNENAKDMEKNFENELSHFEKQVLSLKLTGLDYVQIAAILGKTSKSTDNALQRIKAKLRKVISN